MRNSARNQPPSVHGYRDAQGAAWVRCVLGLPQETSLEPSKVFLQLEWMITDS